MMLENLKLNTMNLDKFTIMFEDSACTEKVW
jgi:hypothetical protein